MPYVGQFTVPWIYRRQFYRICNNHCNRYAKAHFKKSSSSQGTSRSRTRSASAFVNISYNQARTSAVISQIHICLCFQETTKRSPTAFTVVLSYTSGRYTHIKPSHFCIPHLLRAQKATNKMTVTTSSAERIPLSMSPQETFCWPASQVKGDVILHPSNFIVSLVSPDKKLRLLQVIPTLPKNPKWTQYWVFSNQILRAPFLHILTRFALQVFPYSYSCS